MSLLGRLPVFPLLFPLPPVSLSLFKSDFFLLLHEHLLDFSFVSYICPSGRTLLNFCFLEFWAFAFCLFRFFFVRLGICCCLFWNSGRLLYWSQVFEIPFKGFGTFYSEKLVIASTFIINFWSALTKPFEMSRFSTNEGCWMTSFR